MGNYSPINDCSFQLVYGTRNSDYTSLNETDTPNARQLEDHPPSTHTKLHDCIL